MNIHNIINIRINIKINMRFHSLDKILDFIRENRIVTTSEVASRFKISWNTAEKYLLELVIDDKILRMKKKGVNLWIIK